jgi:hypothetical protein
MLAQLETIKSCLRNLKSVSLRPKFNVKTMAKIFAMPGALLAGKKCFRLLIFILDL